MIRTLTSTRSDFLDSFQPMVSVDFTNRIKAAFLDALYAFLDGLVHLAFSEYDPLDPALTTSQKVVADSKLTVDVRELVRDCAIAGSTLEEA